ncbi:unnamed protein product [Orchesella dallaii]|uniref:FHA domain-containing protein n=1 Tax=Orchesella dallaii TaxID=48710 RepID=A0ABP1R8C5_9HEXA
MLKLECTQKPNVSFPLLTNKTYIVGRKQGDITFSDDQSISRTHAEVLADHPLGNINEPMLTPVLVITDLGSKFGTFATEENIKNKVGVNAREAVNLSISDKLRFGLQWNEFRINYTPLVVTTSSVKATQDFKNKICKLGGHFINEWSVYVTHVVMDSITLTIKAVCALLAAKPIVTQAYITDLLSSYETHKPEPDPNNFLPPVAEKGLSKIDDSTFYPNPGRTTLFAGKTFLFCTQRHLKKLLPAIIAGGGNAKLIADASMVNVLASEYIIMGQPLDIALAEKESRVKIILDTYRNGKKRFIGDSEIGLAAVYNSIEKHCNPKCNITDSVLPQLTTQTQSSSSSSSVIVPPTQDIDSQLSSVGDTSRSVVNETVVKPHVDRPSPNSSLSSRGEKRPTTPSSVSVAGSSTSKKRSAVDVLPGRQSKRLKEISQKTASQTSTNLSRSRVALSNLFGMSDSDSEEDSPVIVPESQPNESLTVNDEQNVVPESQPALLNVVELRNLQSVIDTQESGVGVRKEDDDIFVIPESPPDQSQAIFRNPGTDNILTVTESVMNAKTIPSTSFCSVEPSPPPSSSKKNLRLISQGRDTKKSTDGTPRKRQRQDDEDDNLSERTKKINLDEVNLKTEGSHDELTNSLPLIVLPLVNKTLLRRECYVAETTNETGKPAVKNFKTFKKVLPSFIAGVSGGGSSNNASILNVTIEEIQTKRPVVKLVHYDYSPGTSARYVSDLPPLVQNRDRPLRDVEIETPPAFEEFDEFIQPQPPARRTARRLPEPVAIEEPTTSNRRSSPRKKAPPPPVLTRPTSAPVMEVMDEEEDDDDMWTFNR